MNLPSNFTDYASIMSQPGSNSQFPIVSVSMTGALTFFTELSDTVQPAGGFKEGRKTANGQMTKVLTTDELTGEFLCWREYWAAENKVTRTNVTARTYNELPTGDNYRYYTKTQVLMRIEGLYTDEAKSKLPDYMWDIVILAGNGVNKSHCFFSREEDKTKPIGVVPKLELLTAKLSEDFGQPINAPYGLFSGTLGVAVNALGNPIINNAYSNNLVMFTLNVAPDGSRLDPNNCYVGETNAVINMNFMREYGRDWVLMENMFKDKNQQEVVGMTGEDLYD